MGLQNAGMEIAAFCEINEYCQSVLNLNWPNVPIFNDVRALDKQTLIDANIITKDKTIDLIAGGFPCQPHSIQGKRKASEDERDMWPEFRRIIRDIRPKWIVAENVKGLLGSESGKYFGGLLKDLSESGYNVEWQVLPGTVFGTIQFRERVILSAVLNEFGFLSLHTKEIPRFSAFSRFKHARGPTDLRGRPDIPEPLLLFSRSRIPNYVARIKALGNSVVPQMFEWLGDIIVKHELNSE